MGASVVAYWPGITDEQLESQPGTYNDDKFPFQLNPSF